MPIKVMKENRLEDTMGIFDKLKNTAQQAVVSAVQSAGNKRETFTFSALPESLAEMQALPEASLDTPFQAAALTVLALCAYAADKNIGTEMLNWLRGPRPLNGMEISFLNDRFRDGKTYLPFTYFAGSTPENNYTPSEPYTIVVESNHVSAEEQGYMKLFIPCGGADDPRPIKLRQRGSDGKWFLWEQYLLTGVSTPKAADPWAYNIKNWLRGFMDSVFAAERVLLLAHGNRSGTKKPDRAF